MKRFEKSLVLMIILIAAGGLGYQSLRDFEPVKYIIFAAAMLIVSEVFCRIDKYISYKSRKR